jgi:hypothetical protein
MRDERQKAWKIGREEDKFYSNVERKYQSFTCNLYFSFTLRDERQREHWGCE